MEQKRELTRKEFIGACFLLPIYLVAMIFVIVNPPYQSYSCAELTYSSTGKETIEGPEKCMSESLLMFRIHNLSKGLNYSIISFIFPVDSEKMEIKKTELFSFIPDETLEVVGLMTNRHHWNILYEEWRLYYSSFCFANYLACINFDWKYCP